MYFNTDLLAEDYGISSGAAINLYTGSRASSIQYIYELYFIIFIRKKYLSKYNCCVQMQAFKIA